MKKIIAITILTVFIASGAFAQVFDDPQFVPIHPETLGQGGAFVSLASGYHSLYTNPAGFKRKGADLTILGVSAASHFFPTEEELAAITAITGDDPTAIIDAVDDFMIGPDAGGVGIGLSPGIGWVGAGLGLGVINVSDFYGWGPNELGFSGDIHTTLGFVGGLAFGLSPFGIPVSIGADVRPMYRIRAPEVGVLDLVGLMGSGDPGTIKVLQGFGMGLDAGAIIDLSPLTVGIAVRDIFGTNMFYSGTEPTVDNILTIVQGGGDSLDLGDEQYKIPMTAAVGVGFHPDLGALSFLIDPKIQAEYKHTFYAEEDNQSSFWTGVHVGGEVTVLRLVSLRAGLNQGYLTMGVGAKLLFLEVHGAIYSREMGTRAGQRANTGAAVEIALRF
jgi:hypothetical protein